MIFNQEDQKILNDIEFDRSQYSGFSITLDKSLYRWTSLTKECALGYADDVSEYTNDLASRDFIWRVMDKISEDGKKQLEEILVPIDKLFIQSTVEIDNPIMAYDWVKPNEHFWYYRIPCKIAKNEISAFESQTGKSLKGLINEI
ncbi:MAG: hypothetical protein WCV73_04660 [Patescibacteria group bacterium]|jgi:hypothetical protein